MVRTKRQASVTHNCHAILRETVSSILQIMDLVLQRTLIATSSNSKEYYPVLD